MVASAINTDEMVVIDEDQLSRSLCQESFWDHMCEFWPVISPEPPIWNWHIPYLCDELQVVSERVFRGEPKEYDLVINIPPGTTKSSVCSIGLPSWGWTRMPTMKTICGSYAERLSHTLSQKCRDIIRSERYKKLFPEIELRDDQDTKSFFVNTLGGSRYATGVGGSVVGFHGHMLLVDDPLDPQQAVSDLELAMANNWVRISLSQRKIDKRVTPLILIMQRLHQNDPAGERMYELKSGPVKHICLPATSDWPVKPESLYREYERQGGFLDPVRLNQEVLDEAMATLGEFDYAGQFGQQPTPRGGALFKIDKLHYIGDEDVPKTWKSLTRFWDKAATKKKRSAWTVGTLLGVDMQNRVWILDVIRVRMDTGAREMLIKGTAKQDGHKVRIGIEEEPGSGGIHSSEETVKNLLGYRVEVVKADGDKETRAQPFSSQVNNGNVYLRKAAWNKEYVEEMKYFPFSRFKDQIDASSGAFMISARKKKRIGALRQ